MTKQTIHVLHFNGGNLASLKHVLELLGQEVCITADPQELEKATKIIIPGIGHFESAIQFLTNQGLLPVLHHHALEKRTPIMGICLGLQLMTSGSSEGKTAGLGWFEGSCIAFPTLPGQAIKSIHNGWNTIFPVKSSRLLQHIEREDEFFFLHKFHIESAADTSGLTNYGTSFPSVLERENLVGVQFHPEKSHHGGVQILKNFIDGF
jgi:glutamine amidotransferase